MSYPMRKTFSGTGRPRRQNVRRTESGRIAKAERGETQEQVMATALSARIRMHGADPDTARDPKWGTVMGRLFFAGAVTGAHLQVATRYARLKSITAILDDVRPSYGKPILAQLSCGFGRDPYDRFDPELAWDGTDERRRLDIIARVRQDHSDVTTALWELQGHPHTAGAGQIIDRVVCWDDADVASNGAGQALLRAGLNRLDRLWTMQKGH